MKTIQAAWRVGRAQLHGSPSPALDARLLLAHALGRDHAYLVAHGDETLTATQWAEYAALLARAAAGEPIPYLIGHAPFFGLDFEVSPAVLIPRPETEGLVEMALTWQSLSPALSHGEREQSPSLREGLGDGAPSPSLREGLGEGAVARIVDVGTGSGCIAVTLARHLPAAEVIAVDVSADALAVARRNAARHAPGRVHFVRGDLLAALAPGFDLIAANLPYVAGPEWTALPVGVQSYEPALALDGGPDGLELIRALLSQAAGRLRPGGLLLLEIGWRQGEAVAALAREAFPAARVEVRPDFAGHDRVVAVWEEE